MISQNIVKTRTQCNCQIGYRQFENCQQFINLIKMRYKNAKLGDLKKDYENLLQAQIYDQYQSYQKTLKQIDKDLKRTFVGEEFFLSQEGQNALKNVLICIAKYDMKLGYVQGMNFLVAALLYHGEEYVAFWNFVSLYETLQLRDIFLESMIIQINQDLPGLSKHIQMIELLCMTNFKPLQDHFVKNEINFQSFCTPWFLSMLAMVFPIQDYLDVFKNLLKAGWLYFYKLILSYLKNLDVFKFDGPELTLYITNANRMQDKDKEKWKKAQQDADNIIIDAAFVNDMLDNFDERTQTFVKK
ncbi:hypothetical protein pb186bvf_012765 [Paramecium bursaria]